MGGDGQKIRCNAVVIWACFLDLVYCKDSLYFYKSWPDFARISLSVLPLYGFDFWQVPWAVYICLFLWGCCGYAAIGFDQKNLFVSKLFRL